ncbi:Putative Ig domain-containing protein, partial [Salegentibacter salinarum]|uniref:malectin domain-containing carbohydrate-binding protein n=2 Tax=Salegentibacter salinarum TaxID=447422 RepID=UPI0009D13256
MKTLFYSALKAILLVSIYLHFCPSSELKAQSFSQNNIDLNGKGTINNGTSLTFGPDGRLYVAEYVGVIKALTLERTDEGDYIVTEMEQINGIQSIQGYNDDGSLHESTMRQTIGLEVIGTATNPVIYVSTSDFRIGGGGGGGSGDVGLDTNSGIITRFSWNGIGWDELDIVRGLPRSEENHSTNNMEFTTINGEDYLIVASGGHTNAGGPSTNFAYTTEYALSAAILSVNLTMLENMPILDDNGRKYIYDIPTLDDPSRPNLNGITDPDAPGYDGIDFNDPFGGNDGLNQAMIMAGGPVQIFSPGYRNAYDLVVTESGAVYVTDNGANGGWGGFPVNEGGGDANNDYDPGEPGSSYTSGGEKINNKDHLSLVTLDIQSYQFGSFYGGHPTPVRANPYGAGLYTNPAITGTEGAIFRTLIYHPNKDIDGFTSNPALGLPANWPPVGFANPVEGDYRGPGDPNPDGPEDALVTTWGTNTNAIDEYTASNFNGAMKGDLIAGVNTGVLRRVQLNEDGSLKELTPSFASGIGGDALGVACNGDNDIFPGTIWVVTLNGKLVVFEPQDFGICLQPEDEGYDSLADYDGDGYTNQDEIDNETDHCNGGSQPNDHNKAAGAPLISDLNDLDDDNDGIPDTEDPFQLGNPMESGSDAFSLPVVNELFSSNPDLQGYMGLGLTGLMNNGDPNPNWLNWLDRRDDPSDPNPNDILGGAIGAMTMQMTTGTALGTNNNQEKGFQYGVRVDQSTGVFTVAGGLFNFNDPLQLYGHPSTPNGELGIFIGTGFQDNYIKFVLTKSGLTIQQEINDVPLDPLLIPVPEQNRPESGAALFYVIDPVSGNIAFEYIFDNGPRISAGSIVAQGAILEAIQSSEKDLAVGLIGSSNEQGIELEGTWDYLHVSGSAPYIVKELPDVTGIIGSVDQTIDLSNHFNDDYGTDNLQFSIVNNSNPAIEAFVVENILEISFPPSPEVSDITVRATDADNLYVEQTLRITVNEAPISNILYRINAGGPTIMSLDGEVDWEADTSGQNSLYLTEAGGNNTSGFSFNNYSEEIDLSTTPTSIFNTERSDHWSGPPNVTYSFPVEQGKYEVRLYMGNGYHGTSDPGERIFDVGIEGITHPEIKDIDLSGTFGHRTGSVLTKIVDVNDGFLDISLLHGQIENPLINGIEILGSSRGETPIVVSQIPDQFNIVGEELDGSLAAVASGGDGNLSYSISGAPEGVFIEPTNGQIGGTINNNANNQSPYTITIIVDDGDGYSNDAANISFTWTITAGEPYIVQEIPDLNRLVDSDDEIINLNNFFDDNAGKENILYSIEDNSNPLVNTAILDSLLTISFPSEASIANITVRATDTDNYYVEQLFGVTVNAQTSDPAPPTVLYRVNSGGPAIASIDGEIDWGADTSSENSPYLAEAGGNNTASSGMKNYTDSVDLETTPTSIFNSERSDYFSGMPNVMYSFPLDPGTYEIRLYLGNGYHGTSKAGQRIYNVEMEGIVHPELEGIDISGTFGHKVGAVINKTVNVTDGFLNISFIHGVENPLINGIEILGST